MVFAYIIKLIIHTFRQHSTVKGNDRRRLVRLTVVIKGVPVYCDNSTFDIRRIDAEYRILCAGEIALTGNGSSVGACVCKIGRIPRKSVILIFYKGCAVKGNCNAGSISTAVVYAVFRIKRNGGLCYIGRVDLKSGYKLFIRNRYLCGSITYKKVVRIRDLAVFLRACPIVREGNRCTCGNSSSGIDDIVSRQRSRCGVFIADRTGLGNFVFRRGIRASMLV